MRVVRASIMLLSCLSTALFLGAAGLFVRSAWITDQITHVSVVQPGEPERWRACKMRSNRGLLLLSVLEYDVNGAIYDASYRGWRISSVWKAGIGRPGGRNAIERLGFLTARRGGPPGTWRERSLFLPHWGVLLLSGGLSTPLWRGVHRSTRQKRRAAAGMCRACGYDLRATPSHCPECGAPGSGVAPPSLPPGAVSP